MEEYDLIYEYTDVSVEVKRPMSTTTGEVVYNKKIGEIVDCSPYGYAFKTNSESLVSPEEMLEISNFTEKELND